MKAEVLRQLNALCNEILKAGLSGGLNKERSRQNLAFTGEDSIASPPASRTRESNKYSSDYPIPKS